MNGNFYGWYFKHQSDTQTLAIIPAVHENCSSIQLIANDGVWNVTFPQKAFQRKAKQIKIEENCFDENGILLSINTKDVQVSGTIRFGQLTPLKYAIMGPFCAMPFMECRHSIWSMQHHIWGDICINEKKYTFEKSLGYWEGDRGTSFPQEYAWTHCFFQDGSLMLSVADIPFGKLKFTGVIGIIYWKGKEYRFATYLGAKVIQKENEKIWIKQGNYELEACLLEQHTQPLKAPVNGKMSRMIHESVKCRAYYCFRKEKDILFSLESEQASFEYCIK